MAMAIFQEHALSMKINNKMTKHHDLCFIKNKIDHSSPPVKSKAQEEVHDDTTSPNITFIAITMGIDLTKDTHVCGDKLGSLMGIGCARLRLKGLLVILRIFTDLDWF